MKIYIISSPGDSPSLISEDLERIVLGESGRGRDRNIIPITGEGPGFRAKKTNEGIVLVRGHWNDQTGRCFAVINAVGTYDRHRSYGISNDQGVQVISSGFFAFGQAGRTNSGEEVFALLEPGAEFCLNSKYASHWYVWTGVEWIQESPEERRARLALAEVEKGGGEWL